MRFFIFVMIVLMVLLTIETVKALTTDTKRNIQVIVIEYR